ncbi:uncharacterized protein PHACADRAFT_101119 [Phanerochaete carnosa HHB-10118-sp]|uniref:Uncharacterized protein n=1 Tax=Phanerochaete carnosa (strain HHB-10118-sp) TaxID=650164 RepID=K5WQT7_PHACS|nr:uncharacterized protein PHACADRAFT_101119 [Phanerochaete carnosa HHB-10118-sp]EKM52732.1 hypothetical protein PHACADRAFT_101119 [Phanerochaete carnosa HHB-10118-sp]
MHLFWENMLPNLVLLWTGAFKSLDEGAGSYELDKNVWKAIGAATAKSGSTIPSAYGPWLPNIESERHLYTADMWSFWALFLGPSLLQQKFSDIKYYNHFVALVELLTICLQFELTQDDMMKVQLGFADWVAKYEDRYYYQLDPERLCTCVLTIHGLLHIFDGIVALGPSWVYWAFAMERFCGRLQRNIRNRQFPCANLATFVVADARLKQLGLKYNITQMLSLKPPTDCPVREQVSVEGCTYGVFILNMAHTQFSLDSTCVLLPPHLPKGSVSELQLLRRIFLCLATRFNVTLSIAKRHVKADRIELFGKVRRLDGGDTMCASEMVSTSDDHRDATYIWYQILKDRNARHCNVPKVFELISHFAQLVNIIVVHLPPIINFCLDKPFTLVLAEVQTCKTDAFCNTPLGISCYQDLAPPEVIDVTCVQCLVGRLKLSDGARPIWAVIDRSGGLARAAWASKDAT